MRHCDFISFEIMLQPASTGLDNDAVKNNINIYTTILLVGMTEIENVSIVSDLSSSSNSSNTLNKIETTMKLDKLQFELTATLIGLNTKEIVRDVCNLKNLQAKYKMTKPELQTLLMNDYDGYLKTIKSNTAPELKNICREKGISGYSTAKKDDLIFMIMADYMTKTRQQFEIVKSNKLVETNERIKDENEENEKQRLEQIERERLENERVEKERLERERLEQLEKEKTKKSSIPKAVKTNIWNTYIGEDIPKHKCLCCKQAYIRNTSFHAGHVIAEANGGSLEIGNLRPICASCNHAMGTQNMVEFIKTYGYYL
jgi:5-methylcytosine-specific restriction endonuclease McrA